MQRSKKGIEPYVGVTASSDTFYPGQERYDTYSGKVYRDYQGLLKQWQDLNVMNYEMESSTLFTMCSALGLRAGMVAGVIVNRTQQEIPNEATMKETEEKAVFSGNRCSENIVKLKNNALFYKALFILVLFPLDRCGWFSADVIHHTGNAIHLIDDTVRHFA